MGTKSNIVFADTSDLVLYAREQLTMSLAKVTNRAYPTLKYGQLMPVINLQGYDWENEVEILEYDSFGIATVLADSANDGGLVGVVARRQKYSIKTISDFVRIPWLQIQQSQAKDIPLDSKHAAALVYGMEKKNNSIAYDGDPEYGLQGLFTSQLPRMNAATTFAGVSGTTAEDKSRARIDILNNAVTTVLQNSSGMWVPTTIAMPSTQIQLLSNDVFSSGIGKSTLTVFLENQALLGQITEVVVDDTLIGKGENGTDAMLILPGVNPMGMMNVERPTDTGDESPEDAPIYYAIALDFTIPPEFQQWHDTVYNERAVSRVAGVIVEDFRCGLIVSGI